MVLKFRAFDKAKKEFVPTEYISVDGSGKLWNNSTENCHYDPKDWELNLFTGLKDKNGVDIYEGDILKGIGYKIEPVHFGIWETISPYGFGCWCANGSAIGNEEPEFEIIGNIYQK